MLILSNVAIFYVGIYIKGENHGYAQGFTYKASHEGIINGKNM